jgi:hypothetical protein
MATENETQTDDLAAPVQPVAQINAWPLAEGERGLIVGQTGSGKTAFACHMLINHPRAPVVIYDTKIEPKFDQLPRARVTGDMREVHDLSLDDEVWNIIYRPPLTIAVDPEQMDAALLHHYHALAHCDVFIDELYTFASNGRAGPGALALLTRGRSKGITTIMATQRPAWIPRICLTEAQRYYVFRLSDRQDVKRLADVLPDFDRLYDRRLPRYDWYFYDPGQMLEPKRMPKIMLDSKLDTGYNDADIVARQSRAWF